MMGYLLGRPFNPSGIDVSNFGRVFIFMDKVEMPKKRRGALIGGVKRFLKPRLGSTPYSVHMHDSRSHLYLQAADYFCWAMFVNRERSELRPYEAVRSLVQSDSEFFEGGAKEWY